MELNETQIREVVDKVLAEEGLKNFINIFEKEHNLFRGTHEKMGVPPVIEENYYTSEFLNERLWDVDGDNLYYDKGWIGIGKKPTTSLDILGNILVSGDLDLAGDVSFDGAAIFNDSGLDKDFRIESLNDEYAFFINTADDLIGIREQYPTALVHIHARAVDGVPALNLEAGENGEIVTPDGQALRIGHWNSGTQTFTERMKMDTAGLWYVSYLTAGSVVFAGADGELKQDNSGLYWDNAGKKLGINTVPLEALSVDGKIRVEGASYSLISNNTGAGRQILQLRALDAISNGAGINLYGDGDSTFPGQIKFFTNNLTAMTIDAAQLVTIEDLLITTPVNIYNLSHDLFADYLAAQHYDWTNETHNFLTTGTLDAGVATLATGSSIGTLLLGNGSITDGSGAISFGDENLSTTGYLAISGTVDTNLNNLIFEHTGAPAADNISWRFSARSNNEDWWIFAYDGTTSKNFMKCDWDGIISFEDNHLNTTGNVGVGTSTPTTIISTTVAGTMLNVTSSASYGRLVAQGALGGVLDIVDTGGGSNDKWMQLIVDAGIAHWRTIKDDASAVQTDKVFVMDLGSGDIGIGQSTFGTNATKTLALGTGVAPTTSPADCFQMYSADQVAGNACPHIRTENGAIVKLYQQALVADPAGQANDLDSEARTAINAILDILENNGLMANA